jgi:hypothetical protein
MASRNELNLKIYRKGTEIELYYRHETGNYLIVRSWSRKVIRMWYNRLYALADGLYVDYVR